MSFKLISRSLLLALSLWSAVPAQAQTVYTGGAFAPTALAFPDTSVGGSSPEQTVTLTNTFLGTAYSITGVTSSSADFVVAGHDCTTLAAKSACSIRVKFAPGATAGIRSGNITVTRSQSGNMLIPVSGNALATVAPTITPIAYVGMAVTPDTQVLQFPVTSVGSVAQDQLVTFKNTFAGTAVTLGTLSSNLPDFIVAQSSCLGTLAPGATCQVLVRFAPIVSGLRLGKLTLTRPGYSNVVMNLQGNVSTTTSGGSSGSGGTTTTPTTPTTTTPTDTTYVGMGLTPGSADFGSVNVGASSVEKSFVISNTFAGTAYGITSITANNTDFAVVGHDCTTLAPKATCTVRVKYTPATGTAATGKLTIVRSQSGNAYINLTGTGIASAPATVTPVNYVGLSITPAAQVLQYPVTAVGSSATDQVVTFKNTFAGTTVTLGTPTSNLADFTVSQSTCGTTLAPGASCAVTVRFTAKATGIREGKLTLTRTGYATAYVYLQGNVPSVGGGTSGTGGTGTGTGTGTSTTDTSYAGASLSPVPLDFGTIDVGTYSGEKTFTLKNTLTTSYGVSGVTSSSTQFMVTGHDCTTLAAGASCTIRVKFAPSASGAQSGQITLARTANGNAVVKVSGTGNVVTFTPPTAVAYVGALASPTYLQFPAVAVGAVAPDQVVTIKNTFASTAVTMGAVASSSPDFTIAQNSCLNTLAAGASCQITVRFSPKLLGVRQGNVTVARTGYSTITIPVYGNIPVIPATGAELSASPGLLSFASTSLGFASEPQTVTLKNTGVQSLKFLGVASSSMEFPFTTTCGLTLAPNATCTFSAYFRPSVVGTRTGKLTFSHNGPTGSSSIDFSGTATSVGQALLSSSRALLSFDPVPVGQSSAVQTVTFSNPGTTAVALLTPTISGANASDFYLTTTCPLSLAPQATCTASVLFRPSATGSRTATLEVKNSAAKLLQSVPLNGQGDSAVGTTPVTGTDVTALTFAPIPANTKSTAQVVTFTNRGSTALALGSIVTSGMFEATTTCPASLAAGASCTSSVVFAPTASGLYSGVLTIPYASGAYQVRLSGTGLSGASTYTNPTPLKPSVSTISLTNVALGSGSWQPVTFTNNGSATITLNSLSVANGPFAASLAAAANANNLCYTGQVLAVGASCTLRVSVTAIEAGSYAGGFSMVTSAGTVLMPITATVVSPALPPVTVSEPGVVGANSTVVVAVNNPTTNRFIIDHLEATPADFTVASHTCGTAIPGGGSCQVTLKFNPKTVGTIKGDIKLFGYFAQTGGGQETGTNGPLTSIGGSVSGSSVAGVGGGTGGTGTLGGVTNPYQWSDGTTAASCAEYRTGDSTHVGRGAVPGYYKIGTSSVYCDMNVYSGSAPSNETSTQGCWQDNSCPFSTGCTLVDAPSCGRSCRIAACAPAGETPTQTQAATSQPETGPTLNYAKYPYPGSFTMSTTVGDVRPTPLGWPMLVLSNVGSGSVTVGSMSISGPNASDFLLSTWQSARETAQCGGSPLLAQGRNGCSAHVYCIPNSAGVKTATLTIRSSGGDATIPLQCTVREVSNTPPTPTGPIVSLMRQNIQNWALTAQVGNTSYLGMYNTPYMTLSNIGNSGYFYVSDLFKWEGDPASVAQFSVRTFRDGVEAVSCQGGFFNPAPETACSIFPICNPTSAGTIYAQLVISTNLGKVRIPVSCNGTAAGNSTGGGTGAGTTTNLPSAGDSRYTGIGNTGLPTNPYSPAAPSNASTLPAYGGFTSSLVTIGSNGTPGNTSGTDTSGLNNVNAWNGADSRGLTGAQYLSNNGFTYTFMTGAVAASCQEYRKVSPDAPSGFYTIKAGNTLKDVYCDMKTDGGGWTCVHSQIANLPAGSVWQATVNDLNLSYNELLVLTAQTQTTDYSTPLGNGAWESQGFNLTQLAMSFNNGKWYTMAEQPAGRGCGVNSAGAVDIPGKTFGYWPKSAYTRFQAGPTCLFGATNYPDYCGMAFKVPVPVAGARLTGISDVESQGGGCSADNAFNLNYGICVRYNPNVTPVEAQTPGTTTGIVATGQSHTWGDGTLARSCLEYRMGDGKANHTYTGTVGDGVYRIDPDGSGPKGPLDVTCDMTTDGGGYTYYDSGATTDTTLDYNNNVCRNLGLELLAPITANQYVAVTNKYGSNGYTALYAKTACAGASNWAYRNALTGADSSAFYNRFNGGEPNGDCTIGWTQQVYNGALSYRWNDLPAGGPHQQTMKVLCSTNDKADAAYAPAGIVLVDGSRRWADGSFARTCYDYRFGDGNTRWHPYSGDTGSGLYHLLSGVAYCDMDTDGGGWTVIQRRTTGALDFYRGWVDYLNGFGSADSELWLGLNRIANLTANGDQVLRVDLKRKSGETAYAYYSSFKVADYTDNYRLTVSGYAGTAGDSLSGHSGYQFSTYDADHDSTGANCSVIYKGAWWYSTCHSSNLNGAYLNGPHATYADGLEWYSWTGYYESLTGTVMKIRNAAAPLPVSGTLYNVGRNQVWADIASQYAGTEWLWNEANASSGAGASTCAQSLFFNTTGNVLPVNLVGAADNYAEITLNGKNAGTLPSYNTLTTLPTTLQPGANLLVIRATNQGGPAGLAMAVVRTDNGAVVNKTQASTWTSCQ